MPACVKCSAAIARWLGLAAPALVYRSLDNASHALVSSPLQGNFLMSYNNRPATDVIPFLSPFIAPGARVIGPLLGQLAASPLRGTAESALDALKGLSPSLVRQLTPLVEQLAPIFLDVSQGRQARGYCVFCPLPSLLCSAFWLVMASVSRYWHPSLLRQPALPLQQLAPIFLDASQGRQARGCISVHQLLPLLCVITGYGKCLAFY